MRLHFIRFASTTTNPRSFHSIYFASFAHFSAYLLFNQLKWNTMPPMQTLNFSLIHQYFCHSCVCMCYQWMLWNNKISLWLAQNIYVYNLILRDNFDSRANIEIRFIRISLRIEFIECVRLDSQSKFLEKDRFAHNSRLESYFIQMLERMAREKRMNTKLSSNGVFLLLSIWLAFPPLCAFGATKRLCGVEATQLSNDSDGIIVFYGILLPNKNDIRSK